jgi:hypothetical protein
VGALRAPAISRPSTGLVGAAGLSVVLAQVVLNGGPPLLSSLGGAGAQVTALFAAVALFRAPYLVALGLTVRATAPLTRLAAEGGRARLSVRVLVTAGGALALAGAACGLTWPLGPPLVRALFGPGTDLPGSATGGVAAGCVLALGSPALTGVLIAASARLTLIASWTTALLAGGLVLALGDGLGPVDRVVAAFAISELVAVLAPIPALLRRPPVS